MSKFREKSEYMAMRVSGFLGWIHRLVMLITFPIRKFWMIVTVLAVVLIILIAIPMFYGIQLRDVWDWYMIKMPNHEFVEAKDKTLFGAKEQVDKLRRTFNDIVPNKKADDAAKEQNAQKKTRLVSWHVAEFKKAKYKPRPATPIIEKVKDKIIETVKPAPAVVEEAKPVENVVVTDSHYVADVQVPVQVENKDDSYKLDDETDNTVTDSEYEPSEKYEPEEEYEPSEEYKPEEDYEPEDEAEPEHEEEESEPEPEPEPEPEEDTPLDIEDYYTKVNSSDLTYLTPPQIFEGVVKVIGPNSIYVNGKFLFLYGIYTNPRQHDVKAATDYLRNFSEGNQANCFAVARSRKTHSYTALCFVNGTLINRAMVENNFAKNVALK